VAEIRFCTAPDGVRLAYSIHGRGPPLVRVATWLTHLERDWGSPVWRHWLDRLGESHTVVRYDERGCGLSDAEVGEPSVDTWVGDLEAVVDATGLERFALLGVSQGAGIAVAYAARHPERVSDLVLYGGYARGRRQRGQREQEEALVAAIRAGWTTEDPAFRHLFSMLFLPHGTPAQMAWHDELLRTTASADAAVRLFKARGAVDLTVTAPRVGARTLVIHARGDRVVPVEEGRLLASLIPDARLVVLDSVNHILLADEPAWEQFVSALREFLGTSGVPAHSTPTAELSSRELEVLELVAAGLTNEAIAGRLSLSVRTVERHLSNVYAKLRLSGKAARTAAAVSFIKMRASPSEQSR
jgi:pimeloyl-ACP methyl ester carboxylesterase/DNA-binding CsgD family transcriptional regulator